MFQQVLCKMMNKELFMYGIPKEFEMMINFFKITIRDVYLGLQISKIIVIK